MTQRRRGPETRRNNALRTLRLCWLAFTLAVRWLKLYPEARDAVTGELLYNQETHGE
ncbi:MAG: hypothetical protein SF123_15885 [Chloroflexota bacterium]|nr:hypothetical protein [Chloroflexota bacterium]